MLSRRKFLSQTALAAGSLLLHSKAAGAITPYKPLQKLTILHTNDTHSRIDPFPMDGSRNQGLGGVAVRSRLIRGIRAEEDHVLLLDAGDYFQGTPYFNIYKGEPELKSMTAMGYDAVTIGNHEFDAGMENLAEQLHRYARFPVIISNYDFTGTPMENHYVPYQIFRKGRLKIGVLGMGVALEGLVPQNLYGRTQYLDPVQKANEFAAVLKEKHCDLIVCLSHLGYKYSDSKISDVVLAKETENIDVIIGGHTHTFLEKPDVVKNKKGEDVIINQVGWAGIELGRLDFLLEEKKGKKFVASKNITVTKK